MVTEPSWLLKLQRGREHKKTFESEVDDFIRRNRDAVSLTFEPDSEPWS
jgi:hypothetical protein